LRQQATYEVKPLQAVKDDVERLICVSVARSFRNGKEQISGDTLKALKSMEPEATHTIRPLLKAVFDSVESGQPMAETCPIDKAVMLADISEKYYLPGKSWERISIEAQKLLAELDLVRGFQDKDPAKIADAYHKLSSQHIEENRFKSILIPGADLQEHFAKTISKRWRIKEILPASANIVVIYGAPGTYKSFLALDMLLSIATAQPWHGRKADQALVVYVAAEGGAGVLKRVQAWSKYHGVENLDLFNLIPSPCLLDSEEELEQFLEALNTLQQMPGVIVIDTLARSMIGDENHAGDINRIINACTRIIKQTGAQIILIHHTGKDESRGARGSIALTGASDAMFKVKEVAERQVVLTCERQKDDEPFKGLIFRMETAETGYLDTDHQFIKSLVPILDSEAKPDKKTTRPGIKGQAKIALDAFNKALKEKGEQPIPEILNQMDPVATQGQVVHEDHWRVYAYKMGITDKENSKRMAFHRAREKLLDENILKSWDGYFWKT
jgi:hypothetical protein